MKINEDTPIEDIGNEVRNSKNGMNQAAAEPNFKNLKLYTEAYFDALKAYYHALSKRMPLKVKISQMSDCPAQLRGVEIEELTTGAKSLQVCATYKRKSEHSIPYPGREHCLRCRYNSDNVIKNLEDDIERARVVHWKFSRQSEIIREY